MSTTAIATNTFRYLSKATVHLQYSLVTGDISLSEASTEDSLLFTADRRLQVVSSGSPGSDLPAYPIEIHRIALLQTYARHPVHCALLQTLYP